MKTLVLVGALALLAASAMACAQPFMPTLNQVPCAPGYLRVDPTDGSPSYCVPA